MPKQSTKQRIILVDDHEVVRLGLKSLLERHPQFDVIAEAGSAREAIEKTEMLRPDVVVMDVGLAGRMTGIEAAQRLRRRSDCPVVFHTAYADRDHRERMQAIRNSTIVHKPGHITQIVDAVSIAANS